MQLGLLETLKVEVKKKKKNARNRGNEHTTWGCKHTSTKRLIVAEENLKLI